jgi:hypothetical protein
MRFFGGSLAGAGYVVLNIIRVLNIISLLAVIAASSVMLVKTFVVSKFYFFDGCQHVTTIAVSSMQGLAASPISLTDNIGSLLSRHRTPSLQTLHFSELAAL